MAEIQAYLLFVLALQPTLTSVKSEKKAWARLDKIKLLLCPFKSEVLDLC